MINFRYHLVSLTAVFLALAAGITIGAGVVDRATVNRIEGQLAEVASRREATNNENDRLRTDLERWGQFSSAAADRIVAGRLTGTTVFVVGTSGVDRGVVESARDTLVASGATVDGILWFTDKWKLSSGDDGRQLAGILDAAPTTRPEDLRQAALIAVTTAWSTTGDGGPLVTSLLDAGFFDFDPSSLPGADSNVGVPELPRPNSLFVVVSGDSADVPPAQLAEPLVDRLSAARLPVLAAQPVRPPKPKSAKGAEVPPEFVQVLRKNSAVAGRISSVDNIDDFRGRVAAVLALRELRGGQSGHYGFGPDARILPEDVP